MSNLPKKWDPNKVLDISPEEQQALNERAKMRSQLKAEWQKKVSNPYRGVGGYIFDPSVQRFLSMRANHWDQFKATPKNGAFFLAFGVLPIIALTYKTVLEKRELERKCRTGQIAYKDREWKYI